VPWLGLPETYLVLAERSPTSVDPAVWRGSLLETAERRELAQPEPAR
jgi:hypothetical protein